MKKRLQKNKLQTKEEEKKWIWFEIYVKTNTKKWKKNILKKQERTNLKWEYLGEDKRIKEEEE